MAFENEKVDAAAHSPEILGVPLNTREARLPLRLSATHWELGKKSSPFATHCTTLHSLRLSECHATRDDYTDDECHHFQQHKVACKRGRPDSITLILFLFAAATWWPVTFTLTVLVDLWLWRYEPPPTTANYPSPSDRHFIQRADG